MSSAVSSFSRECAWSFPTRKAWIPNKTPFFAPLACLFPVSADFDGTRFTTRLDGALALTPFALVLLMVETTDLIFAVDSIPAVFAVTQKPFIVFTSNVFAILGLRSLYFVLANAIGYFRYLKFGLSLVLVFIGSKMILGYVDLDIPTHVSFIVVSSLILVSMLVSVLLARREERSGPLAVPEKADADE